MAMRIATLVAILAIGLGIAGCALSTKTFPIENAASDNWPYYHGSPAGTHYSTLKEINTGNVHRLSVAWTYDTRESLGKNSTIESNPLVVGGDLFFISPNGRLICLYGGTGSERWVFDPGVGLGPSDGFLSWRRGVSYWTDGTEKRVLFTFRDDLYSIDASTGLPDADFGAHGRVPLNSRVSSPGAVYRDLIIIGGATSTIRAYSVRTGQLAWTFHTIPRPGEFGYETWPPDAWKTASGANNWAGMTLDARRGIVFVPLAFPQTFHGADRAGDNLFANCLVAIDARTGRRLWHFQAIRHDIWDWDLSSAPTLVTVRRAGRSVDAVAQVSKAGFVYVLDRLTGQSLFPIVERSALPSDIPGELPANTQPVPILPAPLTRQHVTPDILTRRTHRAYEAVLAQFSKLRSRGLWDPPSEQGTILFPGTDGGGEWGGAAYDPESGILYANANELASILKLKKVSEAGNVSGRKLYLSYCSSCHGDDRAGISKEVPSLINIDDRLSFSQLAMKISSGGGRMPAFPALASDIPKLWLLIDYLQTSIDIEWTSSTNNDELSRTGQEAYVIDGLPKFVDPDGYPATTPPWGTLSAIDINSGLYAWKINLGEYPELVAQGVSHTGSENYGGPIVTAGGLLFIAATSFDKKFRAFNKRTGELLWEAILPAAGNATPSTYRINGRQFVVIAAGGGRPATAEAGSKVVAFSIPE